MQEKHVALVTGANKGLGKQVAKELVAHGYTVFIGSRDLSNGQRAVEEIGVGAFAIQLDVTDAKSIAAAAHRIQTEAGQLDLLVNNAAIGQSGRYSSVQEILAAGKASMAPLEEIRTLF